MKLFLNVPLSLEEVASVVGKIALPDYPPQRREGLNLGGGDYFIFTKKSSTVLLVCNDDRHAEVYVESHKGFPYYLYVLRGRDGVLKKAHEVLLKNGIACHLEAEAP